MKEILLVGVGSCGINLSASYLSLIEKEHDLTNSDPENSNNELKVHFHDTQKSGSHIARFVFIDQDPLTIDRILAHPEAHLFNPDNLISSNESAQNVYPIAFNSSNIDRIKDVLRKEYERCDSCQGVILNHSSIGGTGSGLTSKIGCYLRDFVMKGSLVNNVILPSFGPKIQNDNHTALSIYNTVLGMHSIVENLDLTFCFDNEALLQKAIEQDCYDEGKWESLNKYVSKAISGITSGTRFTGIQPASLGKICVNSITFPRKHFFSSYYYQDTDRCNDFVASCKDKVQKNIGGSLKFDSNDNLIETYAALFRGSNFCSSEIDKIQIKSLKNTNNNWLQSRGLLGHAYDVERDFNHKEATIITTGKFIGLYIRKLTNVFTACFRRKSFLHWYTSEGMDEMEFTEAESNLNDLQSEYEYVWENNGAFYDEDDLNEESILS